ncbi:MAG: F0F1 ATP synthase subunit B [Sphingomicrobium sp.]
MAEPQTTHTSVEQPGNEEHQEPYAYGFNPGGWVALAMLAVFALFLWKKVHKAIGKALDEKIALIRNQLAEAEALRQDAEALRAEYEAKAKSVDKERKAMLARARKEAGEILAKAGHDAEALIERRGRMAEDKIAAEERAAIDQLRSAAATAATRAAAKLIAERNDAATDAKLVDQAIGDIGR